MRNTWRGPASLVILRDMPYDLRMGTGRLTGA